MYIAFMGLSLGLKRVLTWYR